MNGKTSGLYKHIRTLGRFEFQINLLEECSCSTEFEMRSREQFWMDKQTVNLLLINRRAVSLNKYKEYTAQQSVRSKFKEI
jgi:hypothetical protein